MMADLTDEEIDALVEDGKLSAETAKKMKSGEQPKPTGGNYSPEHLVAAAEGSNMAWAGGVFNSPFQKAMATAAQKAAEDAVAKYHAATRQPAPAPAPITQPSTDLVPPGKTYDIARPRQGERGPGIEEKLGIAPSPAPKPVSSPKVAANLIDPALLDALHESGELHPETAAKLHELNGTESKVAMAEKK